MDEQAFVRLHLHGPPDLVGPVRGDQLVQNANELSDVLPGEPAKFGPAVLHEFKEAPCVLQEMVLRVWCVALEAFAGPTV